MHVTVDPARAFRTALGLAALVAGLPAAAASAAPQRPNVVIVETDDQTVRDMAYMPQTRELIGEAGTTFANSVVSLAECCPSRATLLTGRYAHNHGVLATHPPYGGYGRFDPDESLAVWLQRAGYETAMVGKYFNGYGAGGTVPPVPPGWTEWHALYGNIYRFFGFRLNANGTSEEFGDRYQTDVLTERAIRLIGERAGGRPLFLWLNYVAPHVGSPQDAFLRGSGMRTTVPSPLYAGHFAGATMPRWSGLDEADVFDKPLSIQLRPRLAGSRLDFLELSWRRRIQALQSVDQGVAAIVAALEVTGELRRTLLIFTSDNGFLQGQHRVPSGKLLPYEPSIRVPLLMRGPGVPAGQVRHELVWNGDIAPTVVDAAKARAPWEFDGESLWPVLRDPRLRLHRGVLIEGSPKAPDPRPRFVGVRTGRHLYVRYRETAEEELYDLRRDPHQLDSLAYRPASEAVRARLAHLTWQLSRCRGLTCRREFGYAPSRTGRRSPARAATSPARGR